MNKILRYAIAPKVMLHAGAVLINIRPDSSGALQAWFLSDTTAKKEPRYFSIHKTGEALPNDIWDARHVASLKAGAGDVHIFERTVGQMNASTASKGKEGA